MGVTGEWHFPASYTRPIPMSAESALLCRGRHVPSMRHSMSFASRYAYIDMMMMIIIIIIKDMYQS